MKLLPVILALTLVAHARADELRLRAGIRINHDAAQILLEDVAELSGDHLQRYASLPVADLASDTRREITLTDIRHALEAAGANPGRIAFSGSSCLVIRRPAPVAPASLPVPETADTPAQPGPALHPAAQLAAESTLRGVLTRYLVSAVLKCPADEVLLTFDADEGDAALLDAPSHTHDVEIVECGSGNSATIPMRINVYRDDRLAQVLRLTAHVALRREVLILNESLTSGQPLSAAHLQRRTMTLPPHPVEPLRPHDLPEGVVARGLLREGQILRADDIVHPVLVERNAEVIVRCKTGLFIIRMTARALEPGALGDVIRVRRLADRTEHLARIEADGQLSLVE